MDHTKQVYYFSVQDPDPECLTFGCVATSLDAATLKASIAGFHDVVLLEVRDLRGSEISRVANEEILENPFLGPVWFPLVEELAAAVGDLEIGNFFSLGFLAQAYGYDQNESPYIQGMQEADGSLHLELGSPQLIATLNERSRQTMEFMGWNEPDNGIPNYFRIFEAGWNIRHVAYVALQTLVVAFSLDTTDIIIPSGSGMSKFGRLGLLDRLDESRGLQGLVGYGLVGLNVLAETATPPEEAPEIIEFLDFDIDIEEAADQLVRNTYFETENRIPLGYQFDGDEPEKGEEPVFYGGAMTFHDADVILGLLENEGLIDVRGRPQDGDQNKYEDKFGRCLLGQGKKYGSSCYSEDDVDCYYIDVEVWTKAEIDRFDASASFKKARLVDDPDVLALIGGDNWAVWITRGAPDAEIPHHLYEHVMDVLDQGLLLWSRPIPRSVRPESRFYHATDLLREIAGSEASPVIHVQFHDWPHVDEVIEQRGGSDYLRDAFKTDKFLSCFTTVMWENAGRLYRLDTDVLIEDHFGPANPGWLEAYFPDARPSRYVADDGWVIRFVTDELDHSVLDVAAAAVHAKLGGKIYPPLQNG